MLKNIFCLCGVFLTMSVHASGNIVFGQSTRLIYHMNESGVGLAVNNHSSRHYVMHAFMLDKDKQLSEDFVVTPEVRTLKPNEGTILSVKRLGGVYPNDRETLLYVVGKFVPNTTDGSSNKKMELAYSFQMKVFLRPDQYRLSDAVEASKDKVTFEYKDKTLLINNPTPYHLTFYDLKLDGRSVELSEQFKMIAPFKQQALTGLKKPKKVSWSLISDTGYETAYLERTLN